MAQVYSNAVRLLIHGVEGDFTIAVSLDGEFVLAGGVLPNINAFLCSYLEFDQLGVNLSAPGELKFYYTYDPDEEGAEPDYTLVNVAIVDAEAVQYGIPADQDPVTGTRRPVVYRLFIADMRRNWVSPRGGLLRKSTGRINRGGIDDAEPIFNDRLLGMCLGAMGMTADQYDIDNSLAVSAAMDLDWAGVHAPTELGRLCEQIGGVVCPQSDGRLAIWMIGNGPDWVEPDVVRALPEMDVPVVDRRGKTVVFVCDSIDTEKRLGPNDETWRFVYLDPTTKRWKPQSEWSSGGLGAAEYIAANHATATELPAPLNQFWHFVQMDPDVWPRVPLRPEAGKGLLVRAKIAQRGVDGKWTNSTAWVNCDVSFLHVERPADSVEVGIIQVSQLLAKMASGHDGVETNPFAGLADLADGQMEVTATFNAVEMTTGGTPVPVLDEDGLPAFGYHLIGFTQDESVTTPLTAEECDTAMADPETLVIRWQGPGWELRATDGVAENTDELAAKASQAAELYLKGSGTAGQRKAVKGAWPVELSGKISEIRITQMPPQTVVSMLTWRAPTFARKVAEWRRGRPQVGQFRDAGAAVSQGQANYTQPVVPVMPLAAVGSGAEQTTFMVDLVKDGPASGNGTPAGSGDKTHTASYTYTIKDIKTGNTLKDRTGADGVGVAQAFPRVNGRTVAADKGIVGYKADGTFRLFAWEVPYMGGCTVPA